MILYELFNGIQVKAGAEFINSSNRAFRYGDGLFESIKVVSKAPLFFNDHYERLINGMNILHIKRPDSFTRDYIILQIEKLLSINQINSARIRLSVFRSSQGYYRPSRDDMTWHLSCDELEEDKYDTFRPGITAGFYEGECKASGPISSVKTLNGLLYILAGICARDSGWDDSLIMNQNGNIIEASSSNLFIRKGNTFITPPLSNGCVDGVMRKNVIRILGENKLEVMEQSLVKNDLFTSDEILLTNVFRGIQWVKQLGDHSYTGEFTPRLIVWLNEFAGIRD